jgi:putative cylicin-2
MPDSEKLDTTDEHADDQARDEETPDAGDGEAGESSEGGDPEKDGESTKAAEKGREEREKEPVKFKSPHSPKWWVPLMVSLMVIGLIIVVLAYVFNGQFPIKGLGNGNLFIGFAFMLAGFLMTMGWK